MTSSTVSSAQPNVGQAERVISVVGGGLLFLEGLRERSFGGLILAAIGGACVYRGATGTCSMYKALGINTAEDDDRGVQQGIKIEKSVVISAPREKLYQFWRQLENLPVIMTHVVSVEKLDGKRSRWTAKGPLDQYFTWEAEIINERNNELIAWESLPDSAVSTAGSVHFEDAGNGQTLLRVNFQYLPPAGKLGAAVAKMLGEDPATQVMRDLMQFKHSMESANTGSGRPADLVTAGH